MNLNTICNKNSSIEETVTSSPSSLPISEPTNEASSLPSLTHLLISSPPPPRSSSSTLSQKPPSSPQLPQPRSQSQELVQLLPHHVHVHDHASSVASGSNNGFNNNHNNHDNNYNYSNHPQQYEQQIIHPYHNRQDNNTHNSNNYYYQQQPSESYNQYHHQNHQQSRQPYQAYQHHQQQQIQSKSPSLPHSTSSQHQPHLLEQQPLNYDSNYYLNSAGQSIFKLGKIAQFAAQNREARINYDHRNNSNNSIPVDENHLTFMINRTIDILNILNGLKGDELMRKQKAIITDGNVSQSSRLKYRKRNRAAPPGRCHSCDISETPEWRRGPDGARTLCNACGLRMCFLYFLYLIEK
nr:12289_t:CDS:2 [Entrophospora candida]